MRTLLVGAALVSQARAGSNQLSGKRTIIAPGETRCYTATNGEDAACSAAGGFNITGPSCVWESIMTNGSLVRNFGADVATIPMCCDAMVALATTGATAVAGPTLGGAAFAGCPEPNGLCVDANTATTSSEWWKQEAFAANNWTAAHGAYYNGDNTVPSTLYGKLQTDAAWKVHSHYAFRNNGACAIAAVNAPSPNPAGITTLDAYGPAISAYVNRRLETDYASGHWNITYYNDSACTVSLAGIGMELAGPTDTCMNVTATGSALAASYKAARIFGCNATGNDMYSFAINLGAETCDPVSMTLPVQGGGVCTFSSSTGLYFKSYCENSVPWTGSQTITITTTIAPVSTGHWQLKYFDDNNCTVPAAKSGALMDVGGPLNSCTATSHLGSAIWHSALVTSCGSTSLTMDLWTPTGCSAANPTIAASAAPLNTCTLSGLTGKYYLANCGALELWTTTTTTTTTTVAATTTVAPAGNGTVSEGSEPKPKAKAPVEKAPAVALTKKVVAAYTAVEQLPAGVTSTNLMASTPYVDSKKTGLATALGVHVSQVTITGFTLARRLSENKRRLQVATTVTTDYEVAVQDAAAATALTSTMATAAADIKTATETAMAAADWSAEAVLTAAPAMATPTVAAATTADVAAPAAPATSSATTASCFFGALFALMGASLF